MLKLHLKVCRKMLKRYYKCFSRRFSSYWTYRFLLASSLLSSSLSLSLSLSFLFSFFLRGARVGGAPAWIRAWKGDDQGHPIDFQVTWSKPYRSWSKCWNCLANKLWKLINLGEKKLLVDKSIEFQIKARYWLPNIY